MLCFLWINYYEMVLILLITTNVLNIDIKKLP